MPDKFDTSTMILDGRDFYLRKLSAQDVSQNYIDWLHDKEVNEFLEVRHYRHNIESVTDFVKEVDNDDSRYLFGIFSKETDEHIGNGSVLMINPVHQTFDIGYLIGDKNFWGTSAGYETCLLLLSFAFDMLKLRKCFSGVYSNHVKSRFMMRKIGFIHEATLKEHLLYHGKPVDEVYYGMDGDLWISVKEKSGKFFNA